MWPYSTSINLPSKDENKSVLRLPEEEENGLAFCFLEQVVLFPLCVKSPPSVLYSVLTEDAELLQREADLRKTKTKRSIRWAAR